MSSFGSSFYKGILGETFGSAFVNQTDREAAAKSQEALAMAGINPESVNPEALKATVEKTKEGGFFSGDYLGGVLGGSASLATKLYLTRKLPFSKVNVFGGTKVLNILNEAVKTGAAYEQAGIVFPDEAKELNFLGGMLGGLGAGLVPTAKLKGATQRMLTAAFGDKAPIAANIIAAAVQRTGAGVGETAEELGNTLGPILQESSSFTDAMEKLGEQFPDLSSAGKFEATTMLMGGVMNSGADVHGPDMSVGDVMF